MENYSITFAPGTNKRRELEKEIYEESGAQPIFALERIEKENTSVFNNLMDEYNDKSIQSFTSLIQNVDVALSENK